MAHYAIGDIQGCFTELLSLLAAIHFNPASDRLWLVGDVVNRGPQSLETLRFLYEHQDCLTLVLGNHDMHLLAVNAKQDILRGQDTIAPILNAKDRKVLCAWLQSQALFHYDAALGFAMSHAGIPPQWTLEECQQHSQEVETILRSPTQTTAFFENMYGTAPEVWKEDLQGWDRLRYITNAFTRMRFCDTDGRLEFACRNRLGSQPPGFFPWFSIPTRKTSQTSILFGHWAALAGITDAPNVYALDTGCVWGGSLTAFCLETKKIISVPSLQPKRK